LRAALGLEGAQSHVGGDAAEEREAAEDAAAARFSGGGGGFDGGDESSEGELSMALAPALVWTCSSGR